MRILFFTDNYPPETNAASNRMAEKATYFAERGNEVYVITSFPNFPDGVPYKGYKDGWYFEETMDGVRVIRVKTIMYRNTGILVRILDFVSYVFSASFIGLFQSPPDLIITSSPHLFAPLPAILAARAFEVPLIIEIADLWPDSIFAVGAMKKNNLAFRILTALEENIYDQADHIVGVTNTISSIIQKRTNKSGRVSSIYNGFRTPLPVDKKIVASFRERLFGKGDYFVFGYLGTIGMAHDVERLVTSFYCIKEPSIRLLIMGNGAHREKVEKLVSELGDERIVFLDSVSSESVYKYYNLIDAGIVSLKLHDTMKTVLPTKTLEYASHRKPVLLIGPCGEASNFIAHNRLGVSTRADKSDEFFAALKKVMSFQIDQDAYTALLDNYSRRIQSEKWLTLIQKWIPNAQP